VSGGPTKAATRADAASAAEELAQAIDAIAADNDAMADIARDQRRALARLDAAAVARLSHRHQEIARALGAHEQLRRRAAGQLAAALGVDEGAAIDQLAAAADAAGHGCGSRLLSSASSARGAILRCQREQRVVRQAASGIASHMDGLFRQIAARLAAAGTYAPTGRVVGAVSASGVDLVS